MWKALKLSWRIPEPESVHTPNRQLKMQDCSCQSFDVWLNTCQFETFRGSMPTGYPFFFFLIFIFHIFFTIYLYLFILIYTTSQKFGIKLKSHYFKLTKNVVILLIFLNTVKAIMWHYYNLKKIILQYTVNIFIALDKAVFSASLLQSSV